MVAFINKDGSTHVFSEFYECIQKIKNTLAIFGHRENCLQDNKLKLYDSSF